MTMIIDRILLGKIQFESGKRIKSEARMEDMVKIDNSGMMKKRLDKDEDYDTCRRENQREIL